MERRRATKLPKGTLVMVPKGHPILTDTAPRTMGKRRVTGRPQVVSVDHMLNYPSYDSIRWAGRGGYWKEAMLTKEVIDGNRSTWDGQPGLTIGDPPAPGVQSNGERMPVMLIDNKIVGTVTSMTIISNLTT